MVEEDKTAFGCLLRGLFKKRQNIPKHVDAHTYNVEEVLSFCEGS